MNIEKEKVLNATQRAACPSHPGEILKDLYLSELGVTITDLAGDIGVSRKAVSAIVNGHKSVTAEMAMRFARAMNTTPQLWLNLQANYDIWHLAHEKQDVFSRIEPIAATA